MKKITIAALIVITIIGMNMTAMAGNHGRGGQQGMHKGQRGMGGGHPLLTVPLEKLVDVADQVGITDDQIDALKALRSDYRDATSETKNEMKNKREDLRELMVTATQSDKSAALSLADEINTLQGKLMKNSISASFEVKKIFSEEQLNALKDLAEEKRSQRREERKERRQGHGQNRGQRR